MSGFKDTPETPFGSFERAGEFLQGAQASFEAEHGLRPPKPVPPRDSFRDRFIIRRHVDYDDGVYVRLSCGDDLTNPPQPTLEERIRDAESTQKCDRAAERGKYFTRTRNNFGQEFRIVTKFNLNTDDIFSRIRVQSEASKTGEEPGVTEKDPTKVVGLANRISVYRFLQQKGLVLVDDTGFSAYATNNEQTGYEYGYLFLPESIDEQIYYSFEDALRKRVPMSMGDVDLATLKGELALGRPIEPQELYAEPKLVREIIDDLSLDEEFMSMFTQSDALLAARQAERRNLGSAEPK